jgi:serine/threonine protein phosphatase PrpC
MSIFFDSKTNKPHRETNEDRHNIIKHMNFDDKTIDGLRLFGIYDGHGGDFVSTFLSDNLPGFFTLSSLKLPLDKKFVYDVYDKIQDTLVEKYSKDSDECGSTCLLSLLYQKNQKKYLEVLNSGDCRAVLCRNFRDVPLTIDHKPDYLPEKSRICNMGGEKRLSYGSVCRFDDLSVSRAFGDNTSKPFVTHLPEMFSYEIKSEDRFVIMACDGLWDVFSSMEAVEFVSNTCYDLKYNRNRKINIATLLCEEAIIRGTQDNISVLVFFFD